MSLEKGDITRRFLDFLHGRAMKARAIYILGDMFDAWIGDDDATPPIKTIKQALRNLADSGVEIFLLQGNRDFLLGWDFCKEAGVTLLDDYAVIDLAGNSILLTHGDLLCTDDLPYQAFRAKSRTDEWRRNVLSKPLLLRLLAARWYRFRSFLHKRKKTREIMDVNQQTVIEVMQKHGCLTLIHGHTHRPARHVFNVGNQTAQRFVLAEWKADGAELLCWRLGDWHTERI